MTPPNPSVSSSRVVLAHGPKVSSNSRRFRRKSLAAVAAFLELVLLMLLSHRWMPPRSLFGRRRVLLGPLLAEPRDGGITSSGAPPPEIAAPPESRAMSS